MSGRIQQWPDPLQSSVTKHGNPLLRAALVEAAWRLVRFQPNYQAVVQWRHLLGKGAPRQRPGAPESLVTPAHQLAIDLWPVRTGQLT